MAEPKTALDLHNAAVALEAATGRDGQHYARYFSVCEQLKRIPANAVGQTDVAEHLRTEIAALELDLAAARTAAEKATKDLADSRGHLQEAAAPWRERAHLAERQRDDLHAMAVELARGLKIELRRDLKTHCRIGTADFLSNGIREFDPGKFEESRCAGICLHDVGCRALAAAEVASERIRTLGATR